MPDEEKEPIIKEKPLNSNVKIGDISANTTISHDSIGTEVTVPIKDAKIIGSGSYSDKDGIKCDVGVSNQSFSGNVGIQDGKVKAGANVNLGTTQISASATKNDIQAHIKGETFQGNASLVDGTVKVDGDLKLGKTDISASATKNDIKLSADGEKYSVDTGFNEQNGLYANAKGLTKIAKQNVIAEVHDSKNDIGETALINNSKTRVSLENLTSDYENQKKLLLNDKTSNYSLMEKVGYDKTSYEFSQKTSFMYKKVSKDMPGIPENEQVQKEGIQSKDEPSSQDKETLYTLTQETSGNKFVIKGTYDSPKTKASYEFSNNINHDEDVKIAKHDISAQIKGTKTQVSGNIGISHSGRNEQAGIGPVDTVSVDIKGYTNRTADLNFNPGISTENHVALSNENGNMTGMTFENTTSYNKFSDNGKSYGIYADTQYTRTFTGNGTNLYERVGGQYENKGLVVESFVGTQYQTNNMKKSISLFAQTWAIYRPSEKVNLSTKISADKTWDTDKMSGIKSDSLKVSMENQIRYKLKDNLSLNLDNTYSLGTEKHGWTGSIGCTYNF